MKAPASPVTECPSCADRGRVVQAVTLESLVRPAKLESLSGLEGFRFCGGRDCGIAYYRPEDGETIHKSDVEVRIGIKETAAPRPACYCFDHSVEEIEDEVRRTGRSGIAEDIKAKCAEGLDRCAETNPKGACCLGDVNAVVRAAGGVDPIEGGCCSSKPVATPSKPAARKGGLLAASGAVFSAALSSACCWLPLLLIAFGVSAAGVAGFFEDYRPYLLAGTGLMLTLGFYFVYFRRSGCEDGKACAAPGRLDRMSRFSLWGATVLVLAFALFPSYVGGLLQIGEDEAPPLAPGQSTEQRIIAIDGMTCEGCEAGLRQQLVSVEGVVSASVSHTDSQAVVVVDAEHAPSDADLLAAVEQAGYRGRIETVSQPDQAADGTTTPTLTDVSGTEVLERWFGAHEGHERLVLFLSPM